MLLFYVKCLFWSTCTNKALLPHFATTASWTAFILNITQRTYITITITTWELEINPVLKANKAI